MDKNLQISIVGGGIAGFATGIALLQKGFSKVKIYDRDTDINQRRQGYGLTILQGVSALKKLGVFETIKEFDTPSRSSFRFDSKGNIVDFFGTIFYETKSKKFNLHVSRNQLRTTLYNEYIRIHPEGENGVSWNHKILKVENNLLIFERNEIYSDLIIGCDGINSIVRKFKYGEHDYPLKYLGIIVVLGISKCNHFLGDKRVFQTVNGSTRLFAMPFCESGKIMWQLSFPIDEMKAIELKNNPIALKEHVLNLCGDWHEPVSTIIKQTPIDQWMGIPAYDREPELPTCDLNQNIVLIGDAAHPMSPFKGQGANQALLDSIALADHIESHSNLELLSEQILKRSSIKVYQSRERVQTFHNPSILEPVCASPNLINLLKKHNINSNFSHDFLSIEEAIKSLNST